MSRLLLLALLICSLQVNASSLVTHPLDTIPALSKAEYSRLSNRQNAAAIVMVSVGSSAFIAGMVAISTFVTTETVVSVFEGESESTPAGYYLLAIGGAILALCSIPVFKAAARNRKLAKKATVGLNMEKLNSIPTASITKSYFPALRFTIRF